MSSSFFIMNNNHGSNYGNPPKIINNQPNHYYCYFENEHGEQWAFIYDRQNGSAELRGGDVGWENVYQVNNGKVDY